METSPLTLQARPDVFQNKVVSLYEELFSVGPEIKKKKNNKFFSDSRRTTIKRQQKAFGECSSF